MTRGYCFRCFGGNLRLLALKITEKVKLIFYARTFFQVEQDTFILIEILYLNFLGSIETSRLGLHSSEVSIADYC